MGWEGSSQLHLLGLPDSCSDVMKEGERSFSIPASLPSSDGGGGSTKTEALTPVPFFSFSPCTNLSIQHQR